MSTRWRIVLEYHGAQFAGWQVQTGQRTVQGVVEEGLNALFGEPIRVSASGRTDAGVHAEAQVASFVAPSDRRADAIRDGLNHHFPRDLSCISAVPVDPRFHPRHWAWGKIYRYRWLDRRSRSPLRSDRSWHVRPLNAEAMHIAAQSLLGVHDFSSFRATGCAAAHPVREVVAIEVRRERDEVVLEVRGQGFLRHMVRIIAGTLTEVGRERQPVTWVREVLEARDRGSAGSTAPPHGLTLVEVHYGDGPPPWTDADLDSD